MTRQKMRDLPPGLEKTRQRFAHWRQTRKTRSRIPEPLWTAAARMARLHGINRTAQALRVDYYSLKKRAENQASSASETYGAATPTFLELATPVTASSCECILELEDVAGAKMRIHLKGVGVPDLAALTRSFRGTGL